ncbi:hypothetical protein CTAYLR_003769 [Chrysophaeum taylorii]|uniref:Mitochondrial import receptor subunit TOM70 n=1 Tax=Chrysophaeum taylorii TaxID=2483200 RepID=A0AAD7UDT4_9STRA|nr:hypothetical protein CTAYLR_003769 [Chrysophaeum taylorii]
MVISPRVRVAVMAVAAGVIALVWYMSSSSSSSSPPPPTEEEEVVGEEEEAASEKEEVKAEFNRAKQKAFELFKAQPPKYAEAAVHFSKAIELADAHEFLGSQRVALYNNRSACRERVDDLEASLEDCGVVLRANKMHAKVRRRRARIYEKLGRFEDALVEICADLLIQREDFKKALKEGKNPEQPMPVDNVEAVMRAVGRAEADEILREREERGVDFGMPSSNTITQLLMTYASYGERAARAESDEVEVSGEGADRVAALLRRATKYTYTKQYEDAKRDVEEASWIKADLDEAAKAELNRHVGLFRHLAHDLSGAREAYEASLAAETDTSLRAETRVKLAGVFVDAGDASRADAELDQALAEDPTSSDVYMHRAQLHVIRRDLVAAQRDLEACVAAAPGHVLARLRLATVLIHNSADEETIQAQIRAAERLAPTMSEVYQVKGEILLAKQDLHAAIAEFDEAIALDAHNPVPLYNKGLALIQLNQFDTQRTQQLFEAALKVDPTCMVALMRLSELKLQLAVSFDQAQDVVDMLATATTKCRDKDELVELATVRSMAIAQLSAAKDVGLTSFQM